MSDRAGITSTTTRSTSRGTGTRQRVDFLDLIRGVAIIGVYLFHSLGVAFGRGELPWNGYVRDFHVSKFFLAVLPFSFGWCGVAIFFVVSGFCIHLSYRRNPGWLDFFIRRFFRIYPPYLAAVILFALVLPWTRIKWALSGFVQLGAHLALLHNYDSRTYYGINVTLWSVAVEAQLYLIYPLLLLFVGRGGWKRCLMGCLALEMVLRSVGAYYLCQGREAPTWLWGMPFTYWFSWALGAYLAEAYLEGWSIPFARQPVWLWCALAIASTFFKPLYYFSFTLFAMTTAAGIGNLLTRERKPLLPAAISGHVRLAGIWSYSIYLLHAPFLYGWCAPALAAFISGKLQVTGFWQALIGLTVCFVFWIPVMALSGLSYKFLELPSIEMGKRFCARLAKPVAVREPA